MMTKKQQKEALELLEMASNLLYSPIPFMTPSQRMIHRTGIKPWEERYETLTEAMEDL